MLAGQECSGYDDGQCMLDRRAEGITGQQVMTVGKDCRGYDGTQFLQERSGVHTVQ